MGGGEGGKENQEDEGCVSEELEGCVRVREGERSEFIRSSRGHGWRKREEKEE